MISCYFIPIFELKYALTILMVIILAFCGQFFNMACFNVGIQYDPLLPPLMVVGRQFNSLIIQILKDVIYFIDHKQPDDPDYDVTLLKT